MPAWKNPAKGSLEYTSPSQEFSRAKNGHTWELNNAQKLPGRGCLRTILYSEIL